VQSLQILRASDPQSLRSSDPQILALHRKFYCPLAAALPPDVRRGSATPTTPVFRLGSALGSGFARELQAKGRNRGRSPKYYFSLRTAWRSPALYLALSRFTIFSVCLGRTRTKGGRVACPRLRPASLYVRSALSSTCLFIKVARYLMASPGDEPA